MGETGEVSNPPPEHPVSADILQLYAILASDMTDEAVFAVATNLTALQPDDDNELFSEDPALWRAFALLELLRVVPNPTDLQALEAVAFADTNTENMDAVLIDITRVRMAANTISTDMTMAYFRLIGLDETIAHMTAKSADEALKRYRHTNIARTLEYIHALGTVDPTQQQLTARALGYILSSAEHKDYGIIMP